MLSIIHNNWILYQYVLILQNNTIHMLAAQNIIWFLRVGWLVLNIVNT